MTSIFKSIALFLPFVKKCYEYLYWMKHFNFRLAVINVCPVFVSSELLLSTHLPTSEGWTAELTVGLWLVVPTVGLEPSTEDLTRFATPGFNPSTTPPLSSLHLLEHCRIADGCIFCLPGGNNYFFSFYIT